MHYALNWNKIHAKLGLPILQSLKSRPKAVTKTYVPWFRSRKWKMFNKKLTTNRKLMNNSKSQLMQNYKISIIGAGNVGIACAASCLIRNSPCEVCLLDQRFRWTNAEKKDLMRDIFHNSPEIKICHNNTNTRNSRIIVLTVGARAKPGESRLALAQENATLCKEIVPELAKLSPDSIFIVDTDPTDLITYYTLRYSKFPRQRVMGTGCQLDTLRFCYHIGKRLSVEPSSVQGYIIGEHGKSSVPIWSTLNLGGLVLSKVNKLIGTKADPEKWHRIHEKVVRDEMNITDNNEYGDPTWDIGNTVADLVSAILNDEKSVMCLSCYAKGYNNITDDICVSMPCVIDASGINSLMNLQLTDWEQKRLMRSVKTLVAAKCSVML